MISKKLLAWYEKNKRELPWRKTKDPYKILVSEIMLQQTQVDRVKKFYKDWLKLFPSWKKLAQASNAEVISAWSGLGYNRRALALRDIAKQVIEQGVPKDREAWMKLKGIGPYTSAALALFAQNEQVFPIDSIIRRVAGRIYLGEPFAESKADVEIEQFGLALLKETKNYQDIPQAFFDLGTDICKKKPDCARCPLKKDCISSEKFLHDLFVIPKRSIKKAQEKIHRNKKHPDRIFRGRIVKHLAEYKKVSLVELGEAIDKSFDKNADLEWLEAMVERLEKDGMVRYKGEKVSFID